jgi:hypothetical protein
MSPRSLRAQGVYAAFMALTFLSPGQWLAAEQASGALGKVLLPERIGSLAKEEIVRLTPGVVLQEYAGDKVKLDAGDTLVIFVDRCPKALAEINRKGTAVGLPLAVSRSDQRTVFVFIRDLEDALGDDPRFKIALGRLVAHELEHIRRQSPEHDETGYFKACLSRDDLLRLGTVGGRPLARGREQATAQLK